MLLSLGIWTMNDISFVDELLRNKLYMNTTYVVVITSCFIILVSGLGCFAAFKEVKCLLLTHFLVTLVLSVCLLLAGVLTFIFREQVSINIMAEMIEDIRKYDPSDPSNPVTTAWDKTQQSLSCCGIMTEQVNLPWEMWRYNKALNPTADYRVVPTSCCLPETGGDCIDSSNKTVIESGIFKGDCLVFTVNYVREHAATMGSTAVATSVIMVRRKHR